jgi:hypothetical protein
MTTSANDYECEERASVQGAVEQGRKPGLEGQCRRPHIAVETSGVRCRESVSTVQDEMLLQVFALFMLGKMTTIGTFHAW